MELPDFDLAGIPSLTDSLDAFDIECELAELSHLAEDRRLEDGSPLDHVFRSEATDTAAQSLGRLPAERDCFHLVINGRFSLWEYVPACLSLAGEDSVLASLHIATLLMMRFTDGRHVTLESSANLRSCKNLEQVTAFGSAAVYRFHVDWIEALLP